MSTCAELDEQIAGLSTQLGNLNAAISDKEGEINDQILICIIGDNWPGGPPTTWDETSINTRMSFLGMYMDTHPWFSAGITVTLEKYSTLRTYLQQKASLVAQKTSVQAQLNQKILEKQQMGCP